MTASVIVEETTGRTMCATAGVEEFNECLFCTSFIIIFWLLFVVPAKELDGGEGSNAILLCEWPVGSSVGVDVGNDTLKSR